jgi:tetratricopeptide (TPR) repeat protein
MKKIALAVLFVAWTAPAVCASYDDLNVALSYFDQGQVDSAIPWFDKAIAAGDLIPDQTRIAYLDRGMIYSAKGDGQKAIADFTAAIAAQPNDLLAYRNRISSYLAVNEPEKALADYETLRKMRPYDYDILVNTGFLDWQLDRPEAAADAFAYFAPINSPVSWIWLQLANTRLGRPMTEFKEGSGTRNWPVEVARFYLGRLSEDDVLQKARDIGTPQAFCTANLLTGLWRRVHHDEAGAAPLLQAALEKCPKDSPYGRIARAELGKTPGDRSK